MITLAAALPSWVFLAAGAVIGLGLIASMWRLAVGPTLADRVVALDLIGFLIVGAIALFAIISNTPPLLTVAMIAAIILFVGTAAFAIFIERGGAR